VLFFVSGLLLWYGERDTRFRLPGTVFLHDTLMYLSVLIVAGHLYLSLVHPATRHALRGMTLGKVREDWARRHHEKWARERGTALDVQLEGPQAAQVEPRAVAGAHDLHQHRLAPSAANDGARGADVDV
jgi:formate dehydrogenase subunit gamma